MKPLRILIKGKRQEGSVSDFISSLKSDNIQKKPYEIFRQFFDGTDVEFNQFLIENKFKEGSGSYSNFHTSNFLNEQLGQYLENFVNNTTSKQPNKSELASKFKTDLGAFIKSYNFNRGTNMYEEYSIDLTTLDDLEYEKFKESFSSNLNTPSTIEFIKFDDKNKIAKVVVTNKIIYYDEKKDKYQQSYDSGSKIDDTTSSVRNSINLSSKDLAKVNLNLNFIARSVTNTLKNISNNEIEPVFRFNEHGRDNYTKSRFYLETLDKELPAEEKEAIEVFSNVSETIKNSNLDKRGSLPKGSTEKVLNEKINDEVAQAETSNKDIIANVVNESVNVEENKDGYLKWLNDFSKKLEKITSSEFVKYLNNFVKTSVDEAKEEAILSTKDNEIRFDFKKLATDDEVAKLLENEFAKNLDQFNKENASSKEAVEKEEQEVEQEEVEEQQANEPVVNEAPTPVGNIDYNETLTKMTNSEIDKISKVLLHQEETARKNAIKMIENFRKSIKSNNETLVDAYEKINQEYRGNPFAIAYFDKLVKMELLSIGVRDEIIEKHKDKISELLNKIEEMREQFNKLYDEKAQLIQKHEVELQTKDNEINKVSKEFESFQEKTEKEINELVNLAEEQGTVIKSHEENLENKNNEITSLNKKLENLPMLEEQLSITKDSLNNAKESLEVQTKTLEQYKDSNEFLDKKVQEQKEELVEKKKKIEETNEELQKQDNILSELRIEQKKAMQENSKLKEEITIVKDENKTLKSKIEIQNTSLNDLKAELEEMKALNEKILAEKDDILQKYEEAQEKLKLSKEYKQVNKNIKNTAREIDNTKKGIDRVNEATEKNYKDVAYTAPLDKNKVESEFTKEVEKDWTSKESIRLSLLNSDSFDLKQIETETKEDYESVKSHLDELQEIGIVSSQDGVYKANFRFKKLLFENRSADTKDLKREYDLFTKYDKKNNENETKKETANTKETNEGSKPKRRFKGRN